MRFDLGAVEEYVASHLRVFIFLVVGLVIFVGIIAIAVFFYAVHGEEQTMIPDVRGKELTEALLELQIKELYPRLQLRYSQTSRDKGFILEQEPKPGTIVKAGRRIRLVVSQGVIVNKVENFISRNIDEVKMDLLALQAEGGGLPLISVKEPIMYDYSNESPGIILAQKPEAGTDISRPISLEFVVSKGRENLSINVPQFTGLTLTKALETISGTGVNFTFVIKEIGADEVGETIVAQTPAASSTVSANTPIQLTVTRPEKIADNEIFGLYKFTMPQNPYPLPVRLEAQLPSGEKRRIFTVNYMGGEFTIPYKLPIESTLILSMLNRELDRETVGSR